MKMQMPRECFDEFMEPLTPADAQGLEREASTGCLKPTSTTATLRKWHYSIRKGSVSDRLFHLQDLDPPPPPPRPAPKQQPPEQLEIGSEDVYEVEAILGQRKHKGRIELQVKWLVWDDHPQSITWEPRANINKADLDAYLGKPTRVPKRRRSGARRCSRIGEPAARARGCLRPTSAAVACRSLSRWCVAACSSTFRSPSTSRRCRASR